MRIYVSNQIFKNDIKTTLPLTTIQTQIVITRKRISNLRIVDLLICSVFAQYNVPKNTKNTKETEKKWKKTEQDEMKGEHHQLDLKEGYEQDEKYDESEE